MRGLSLTMAGSPGSPLGPTMAGPCKREKTICFRELLIFLFYFKNFKRKTCFFFSLFIAVGLSRTGKELYKIPGFHTNVILKYTSVQINVVIKLIPISFCYKTRRYLKKKKKK